MNSNHSDIEEVGDGLVDELEEALVGEEVDVGRSADEAVHVLGRIDVEMHVDSVNYLVAQDRIYHISLHLAYVVAALIILDPGRMPSHIAIFAAAQQNHLLEVP